MIMMIIQNLKFLKKIKKRNTKPGGNTDTTTTDTTTTTTDTTTTDTTDNGTTDTTTDDTS